MIVEIEPGCLMAKAGVEVGDVLDELCGEHVVESSRGRVSGWGNNSRPGANIFFCSYS